MPVVPPIDPADLPSETYPWGLVAAVLAMTLYVLWLFLGERNGQ